LRQCSRTYSFSGDTGKCSVVLAILEGLAGSMEEGDFFELLGEVGFANADSEGEFFRLRDFGEA
jgi:hypothetical protein